MYILHDLYDNISLDFCIARDNILSQAVGRSNRTPSQMAARQKELTMHAHGQTTVWGTPIGVGRVTDTKSWSQQIWDQWTAYKAARHDATRAPLSARWDARYEAVRPLHADAAIDMVASTHAFSTTTARCDIGG
jgi:hypothetical protein